MGVEKTELWVNAKKRNNIFGSLEIVWSVSDSAQGKRVVQDRQVIWFCDR